MKKIGKAVGGAARKAAKAAGRVAAKGAAGGLKKAAEKAPDFETFSKWLIRVVTKMPQYLQLYVSLLVDNRVGHKAKVLLVTGIAVIGAQFALTGPLAVIQKVMSFVFGPFALLPSIIILLITLDMCYQLLGSSVLEEYEKKIFGEKNSVQADLQRVRKALGSLWDRLKAGYKKKSDAAESHLEKAGLIEAGELRDDKLQDAVDQVVEIQTSKKLQTQIDRSVKKLQEAPQHAKAVLQAVRKKLPAHTE